MDGQQLRVIEGNERGKGLSVDVDLLIGRLASEDEGRLGGDPEISRRHAYVARGPDGRLTIEDLGSANGTYVNGERIEATRTLDLGDVVRVGRTVLEVTDASGRVPERARPPTEASLGRVPGEAAAAQALLMITGGAAAGRRLVVEDELIVGRAGTGDGRLSDDLKLSRRHARIAREAGGRLTIEDLGSANGTFVNGERVQGPRALSLGDTVQLGSMTLELTGAGPGPVPPPIPPAPPPIPPAAPAAAHRAVPPPPPPVAPPRAAAPPPPPRAAPPAPPQKRVPVPASSSADRQGVAPVLPLDSVFAGCRVEEVIGYGAMGVVYRGEELALKRRVALKLIRAEHSQDERFRERFRRESQIAAAIDHPNVIPIFDAGDQDGVLFIMMRLVQGTDLRALIAAEGHVDPLRTARIVRQVGGALDAAHARGMLHRDIKPSNVLLGRQDHVYLSDFGLAKRADAAAGLTRHGTVIARAEYVSPEQILNQRFDARADIYALGCMLFEALTGEMPFASADEGPGPLAHVNAPPPTPSELRPELPRKFDEVVHRAMAKDPSERYPSAGDLGQAALVAAGELRRASAWSVVARGEAAPVMHEETAEPRAAPPRESLPEGAPARGSDELRWAIALAGLLIVALGMVAALKGISSL